MTILTAAQNILIQRAVDIYIDMRDTLDSPSEYRDHFGNMGDVIAQIEGYGIFGDICNAITKGGFEVLGLAGDEDELIDFISDVKKYVEKWNK